MSSTMHPTIRTSRASRRGVSLAAVAGLTAALSGLALASLTLGLTHAREQSARQGDESARWAAEAGLAAAVADLRSGGDGTLGDADAPLALGSSGFYVEASEAPGGLLRLVATGFRDRHAARIAISLRPDSGWDYGVFAGERMAMDSNARVDSYDSALGSYDDQVVNHGNGQFYANGGGDIASNGPIHLDANSWVHGNAWPGPDDSVSINSNAGVDGSTAPLLEEEVMPTFVTPEIPSSGPLTVEQNQMVQLPSGDYAYDVLETESGAALVIHGPATVVCDSFRLGSNSELLIDAQAGPVELYVRDDFVMSSNTIAGSIDRNARDLAIYLESDNIIDPGVEVDLDEVDFESNSQLYGTLLAPYASIELNSNFELFGAMSALRILLDSYSQIHYDEALGRDDDPNASMELANWVLMQPPRRVRDEDGWHTVEPGAAAPQQ
jgi:hypothetical protein